MAVLYGLFSGSLANNKSPENLSQKIKWPGSVEHKIHFYAFSGGLILNTSFETNLSEHVYQNKEDQILVLMSGFIYNRSELLNLLNAGNENISNPEVAYKLFKKMGKEFAEIINGDFTILIYRKEPELLLIYRDHVGIRPISYFHRDDALWFSSDGMGLCQTLQGREKINPEFLYRFFKSADEVDVNLLPLKGAVKLAPGSYLEVSSGLSPVIKRYWNPEKIKEDGKLSFNKAKTDLNALLKDSVQIRADKRFKAGAHLSGGLDSGIVAALARKHYFHQDKFFGFSWSTKDTGYINGENDERKNVEGIGRQCGITPAFLKFNKDDISGLYSNWRYLIEFFHEELLRINAKEQNVNLIFSGWGGDEFMSINSRGIDSDLFFKLQWKALLSRYPVRNPKKLIKMLLIKVIMPALSIDFQMLKKEKTKYNSYLVNKKQITGRRKTDLYHWKSRRDVHLSLLNFGHLAERTEHWFINGYRIGLEYRYPLLDKRIIEYMLKVPSKLLFKKDYVRLMLRELSHGILPDSVTWSNDKSNPALFETMYPICTNIFHELAAEIKTFKSNPDLEFINFDALENDIQQLSENSRDKDFFESMSFTLGVKRIHEFTQGYYLYN